MLLSRLYGFLLTLLALACAAPVAAQGAPRHLQAELVAETMAVTPGQEVALAVVMRPDRGWHDYWQYPGQAGFAPQFSWKLPGGARISAPEYGVPRALTVAGLANYVFEGEHALLFRLRLPAGLAVGAPVPLEVGVRYLVCTAELCVPEEARLSLVLRGAAGPAAHDPRFDRWRAAIPTPLGGSAHFSVEGKTLRLGIPFPADATLDVPHFFPLTAGAIDDAAPQRFERQGDLLVVTIARTDAAPLGAVQGVLALGSGRGVAITARPGPVAQDVGTARAIVLAIAGAVLGGLILNVMPCVFPILSLKALSLAQAGTDERSARREALAYAAGAILTLTALGAVVLAFKLGWAFQLQDPRVVLLLLLLMIALTGNLAGLFELPVLGGGVSMGGGFWTGALAAFVATPCTGPFMGAALGAALVLPPVAGLAVFAGLGLGLALPFLGVGFVPALRRRLPRPGRWMITLRRVLAVPMGLTAAWLAWILWRQGGAIAFYLALLTGAFVLAPLAIGGLRQRLGQGFGRKSLLSLSIAAAVGVFVIGPVAQHGGAHLKPAADAFSEARLAQLRSAHRPVFVYFTADWCLTCKVNERGAIDRSETRAAFAKAGIATLVGDFTNNDPAIGAFLRAQGRAGVPLYLFYPRAGAEPVILPQVLTPGTLVALAK